MNRIFITLILLLGYYAQGQTFLPVSVTQSKTAEWNGSSLFFTVGNGTSAYTSQGSLTTTANANWPILLTLGTVESVILDGSPPSAMVRVVGNWANINYNTVISHGSRFKVIYINGNPHGTLVSPSTSQGDTEPSHTIFTINPNITRMTIGDIQVGQTVKTGQ